MARGPAPSGRALILLAAILGLTLAAQASYFQRTSSAVWDEGIYLTAGLDFFHHGRVDRFFNFGIAPLPVMLSYWTPALAFAEDQIAPADFPRAVHLARVTHLVVVGLPLVILPALAMARRRGLVAGAAVGGMLVCSPLVVAFSAIAVTDACFALAFLLALGALDGYRKNPGPKRLAMVALAVGVALAAKYTALLLLPLALGVFLRVERGRPASRGGMGWRRPAAAAFWQTLGVGAAALLLVWSMHGFAVTRVLPDGWNPPPSLRNDAGAMMKAISGAIMVPAPVRGIVFQIEHASGGQQQFLMGQKSSRGWWYYYPLAWLFKSTPAELLLAALLPVLAWKARRGLDETAALLAAGATLVMASLLLSKLDLGVRYMLVIYPLAALLAIECAAVIRRQTRWVAALMVGLVALQAASAAAAAPQYLSYFNRVFTPPGQAYTRLVDSNLDWGQDLPALRAALNERGTNRVLLAYFGVAPPEAYGIEATPWDTPDEAAVARQRWIAISATLMNNVYLRGDPFRDFRQISADARPSEGLFIYDASRPEVRRALEYTRSRVALQPCRTGATAPKITDPSWSVLSHWYIRCTGM
jgi:4-amino-4-deoxy-L-arabinose transferase-like glycosyltransferase